MEAALEGLDSILGAGSTWYMYTIRRKSKLKAIQGAKISKMMGLRWMTCVAARSKEHFSISHHAQQCYPIQSLDIISKGNVSKCV